MKKILLFTIVVIVLNACQQMRGSGNVISQTRNTSSFTGIDVGGAYTVEVQNGPQTIVVVEADDNLIKYVETKVSGNTLYISTKGSINFNDGNLKILITSPDIKSINSSGAATVHIKNTLKDENKITLESSGAATINGEIDAPEVSVHADGAANIDVSGHTKNYNAEASGSGTIKTGSLMSETVKIDASGAASVHVYASVSLTVEASGAANIHYKGAGNTVINTSGAASVKKED